MKTLIVSVLFLASVSWAAEETAQQPSSNGPKMTTKDAKKSCKDEGKTGAELIKCMKEKKDEK